MNQLFKKVQTIRRNDKTKEEIPAVLVTYKNLGIALFTGENLDERADAYLKTYGYLAEWYYQISLGNKSWHESMYVQI